MDIRKKETEGINISIKVDSKNYKKLIGDIKRLGKKYEYSSNVNKLNYSLLANFQRLPYVKVRGICSRVIDKTGETFECLFLDFDNRRRDLVESECRFLYEVYNLSPIYLFTTEELFEEKTNIPYGNYHAICITKCHFKEIIEMQSKVHSLDPAYSQIPKIYKHATWVLRQGKKNNRKAPTFVKLIGDTNKKYNQYCSRAHLKFIEGIYPKVPKIKYTNLDNHSLKDLTLTEYSTASNIKGNKK